MSDETSDDQEMNEEGSFAEMFEQSMVGKTQLEPGQKISATVLQIGKEWIFLDVGRKGEGVLDAKELLDDEGNLTVSVGDQVSAYFISRKGGELRFTTRLGSGSSGTAQLEEAWRSEIPVEGRIEKEVKGGYEIKLPGNVRAFCPFSQLGLRRLDNSDEVIGDSLSFRITQFDERGRNIVVSHRVILDEERRQQREELKKTLKGRRWWSRARSPTSATSVPLLISAGSKVFCQSPKSPMAEWKILKRFCRSANNLRSP